MLKVKCFISQSPGLNVVLQYKKNKQDIFKKTIKINFIQKGVT